MEYITREKAQTEACKFLIRDARRLNKEPDMDCCRADNWLFGFRNWIDTAYNGKLFTFEEMAMEYNSNRKRKFIDHNGKSVSYCVMISNFIDFIHLAENRGKCYTLSRFITENYKEVYING